MADVTDQSLIRAYVRGHCEQSFGELVHRHVDFVHSTALRVVRDASLAEDVTKRVFLTLAKHSVNLQERSSLTGWLHETARNLAINTVRGEERRRQREQEAATMSNLESNGSDAIWNQIAPHLDEAIAQLNSVEREVILCRYFERRTAEQIGGRLGLTPEAAQKRVARALDRLRGILVEGGLTVPTTSLTVLLSTQAVQSAPGRSGRLRHHRCECDKRDSTCHFNSTNHYGINQSKDRTRGRAGRECYHAAGASASNQHSPSR